MRTRETFYRPDQELGREASSLSASLYNLAHVLLRNSGESCLFVPIRSMQYLAVFDAEECIFVDGHNRHQIELAWQAFRPSARATLSDPVPYEVVYYVPTAFDTHRRVLAELEPALELLHRRSAAHGAHGSVVSFPRSPKS
ncbi:MAG: hypothetical protein AMJ69_06680 [Gammaproteobacteria bacterium SG8_47]|nr:MAG: hypothetical protein AMJ69_06680 [Gammaproteobacteria bacterium SG8_47]